MTQPPPIPRGSSSYTIFLEQRVSELEERNDFLERSLAAENDRLERADYWESEAARIQTALNCLICSKRRTAPDWCCNKAPSEGPHES